MAKYFLAVIAGLIIFTLSACAAGKSNNQISYTANVQDMEIYMIDRQTDKTLNLTNNPYDEIGRAHV